MRYVNTAGAITLFSFLIGCTQPNPALQVDADTLAVAINSFEPADVISHMNYESNCGAYFVDPKKFTAGSVFAGGVDAEFKKECDTYTKNLAIFLNTKPQFKNISAQDLSQPETWQRYFQSKQARGRG